MRIDTLKTMRLCVALWLTVLLITFSPFRVNAAMPQANYLGTVAAMDAPNNLITIQTDAYRWTLGGGDWLPCDYTLEAEAPNSDVILRVQVGDRVEASSIGEPGTVLEGWVSLARLNPGSGERITDAYGDVGYLFSALEGAYSLDYATLPDCPTCMGCWCEATSAHVEITSDVGPADEVDLEPGEGHRHYGDPYCLYVMFHSGEANGYPTCVGEACGGPQLVSDFTLHIIECENPGWFAGGAQASLYGSRCYGSSVAANVLAMCLIALGAVLLLRKMKRH